MTRYPRSLNRVALLLALVPLMGCPAEVGDDDDDDVEVVYKDIYVTVVNGTIDYTLDAVFIGYGAQNAYPTMAPLAPDAQVVLTGNFLMDTTRGSNFNRVRVVVRDEDGFCYENAGGHEFDFDLAIPEVTVTVEATGNEDPCADGLFP
jgi:hypothetical protein